MGTIITIGDIQAYEVRPKSDSIKGGLIVIHEVWGLTDHIKDMAERYAKENYYVIAPNLLQDADILQHATTQMQHDLFNPEKRNAVQPKLRELMAPINSPGFAAKTMADLQDCFNYLYVQPSVQQKVGVLGYCFGGTYSFNLVVQEPRLIAAVPYYGHSNQTLEELQGISCPILAFYGELDSQLMTTLPKLQQDMNEANADFTAQVYGGTGHAFNNDTNPFAYNRAAAQDAWQRSLDFFAKAFEGSAR